MDFGTMIFGIVIGFCIGRIYTKWADGLWDYEAELHEQAYTEGYTDAKRHFIPLYPGIDWP